MTLDDLLNALDTHTGEILVIHKTNVNMPQRCWLIDVHEYVRIDDYVPDDLLMAHVVEIRTGTPMRVVVDL